MNNKPRKKINSNRTPNRHFVVTEVSWNFHSINAHIYDCWSLLQTRQVRIQNTGIGIETLHNPAYAYVVCNSTNTPRSPA